MGPRACAWCHQTFAPSDKNQRYCSQTCARGSSLSHVRESRKNSPENKELKRQYQRRRIEAGTHAFIRPGTQITGTRGNGKPKHSQSPEPRITIAIPEVTPSLPPLPDIPEETDEDTGTLVQDLEGPKPLEFPLQGEDARREWQNMGELREAQADKALAASSSHDTDGRTIILAGQGSYLGVEGFALVCHQGRTHGVPAPERELLQPAIHGVKRITFVAAHGHQTGTLTLAAASWCRREGIHLCVLDGAGTPLLEVFPIPDGSPYNVELERRQWLVSSGIVLPGSHSPSQIAHEIVKRKVEGQYQTLLAHPELPGQSAGMELFKTWHAWLNLNRQYPIEYLVTLEGRLAYAYFKAWEGWPLQWSKTDLRRLPSHWLTARSRVSPLSQNGRHAVDPINACLNYLYSCLASQCRQALLAEGFSLSAGFLHSDRQGRDSLTYDLAELERGAVDDLLLKFLGRTTLHYGDFARDPGGKIMLHPQLTRLLLAECRVPQSRVDAHARWLKSLLFTSPKREDTTAPARN